MKEGTSLKLKNTAEKKSPSPLVSVEMITYNHAAYIGKAIEGVLMQETDFPFELVIGEDCSTDETLEIVHEYQKKYPDIIRVVTSEENIGCRMNNKRTHEASRGKYVAWCEGDDYWHRKDKLQLQVNHLEEHPQCGLVCSDYDLHKLASDERIKNNRKNYPSVPSSPDIEDILLGRAYILTVTAVARKNLVDCIMDSDPVLYQTDRFPMGDTQLWAELSLQSEIHCLEESMATHNLLEESATQGKEEVKRLNFWQQNSEMVLYLCDKYELPQSIRTAHERGWNRKTLRLAFLSKRPDLADLVAKKYGLSSVRDVVWYLGSKFRVFRPLITIAMAYKK